MKLNVLENKKNKLKIEVTGESHTLLNLLRENAWKSGAKQASYMIEHPYLAQAKIIVYDKTPKKILVNAAQLIIDQSKEFSKEFNRALKK